MLFIRCLRQASWVLAYLFGTAVVAQPADSPEARRVAAQELIKSVDSLMGPERMMAAMKNAMQAPMQQVLQNHPRLTTVQKQRAAQVMGEEMGTTMGAMMKEIMPGMYAAMTQMYVEHFSVAEIQELQRYYASTVVRRATQLGVEELPRLMQPMMATMAQWAPKLQESSKQALEKLRAEGIELEGQSPAPAKPQAKSTPKKSS